MPKGPEGQKRPADAVARAVMVGKIATGELADIGTTSKAPRGSAGGRARANRLSRTRRIEIAKSGATARRKEAVHE